MSARGQDTEAIILRTQPMRESDLVVILCTAKHGKVPCAARGARKSKRRFAGGLPVGGRGDARMAPGRGSLWNLEGFSPTADHASLGRDLERFAFANYLCELCDRLTVDLDPVPNVFASLWESLEQLAQGERDALLLRSFELRLLAYIGSLPEFERCAACGDELASGPVPFDAARGGALCARHGQGSARLDPVMLAMAQRLLHNSDDAASDSGEERGAQVGSEGIAALGATFLDPRWTPARRRALRDLCVRLLHQHLSRPLRSLSFFQDLQRAGRALRGSKATGATPGAEAGHVASASVASGAGEGPAQPREGNGEVPGQSPDSGEER